MAIIKLVASPFTRNMEVAGDVIVVLGPADKDRVQIQLSPNVANYQQSLDPPMGKFRELTVTTPTIETRVLQFDLCHRSVQRTWTQNKVYSIRLLSIGSEKYEGQDFSTYEFQLEELDETPDLAKTGTVMFCLEHPNEDWPEDGNAYNFPAMIHQDFGFAAVSRKHPDKTVEVEVSGPLRRDFVFREQIPNGTRGGLMVGLCWTESQLDLFLNGELVATRS